jgi:hypothetical protein
MNKQELIEKIENLNKLYGERHYVAIDDVLNLVTQLDEAPRYLKNLIARLRELQLHDREVWLKAIMSEFEQDFSHAKWREGYEQGKFEGMIESEKVTIPQFVADWLSNLKSGLFGLNYDSVPSEIYDWVYATEDNLRKLHLAFVYGYEVEEEKRYQVSIAATGQYLGKYYINNEILSPRFIYTGRNADYFTRKELEEAGFAWVFNCDGVDVEEV